MLVRQRPWFGLFLPALSTRISDARTDYPSRVTMACISMAFEVLSIIVALQNHLIQYQGIRQDLKLLLNLIEVTLS